MIARKALWGPAVALVLGVGLAACGTGGGPAESEAAPEIEFKYTVLYVPDVDAARAFYGAAFGLETEYIHESGQYAELRTGDTRLAVAAEALASDLGLDFRPSRAEDAAPAFEIGFTVGDVDATYAQALAAGAISVQEPTDMPWDQRVAYVRDPTGVHIVIATPPKH